MEKGSLVMLALRLSQSDRKELREAGYSIPEPGKEIFEVKCGPYLTVFEGISCLAVTLHETGHVEWATPMLVEVQKPMEVDLNKILAI